MEELFEIQQTSPPRLHILRQKYDAAKLAYDEASAWEDETGEPIPAHVKNALVIAGADLLNEEKKEIKTL